MASRSRSSVLILLLIFSLVSGAHAGGVSSPDTPPSDGVNTSISADYFYSPTCSQCRQVRPLVDALAREYPQAGIRYREIYFNATNREIFRDVVDRYGIESETIPLLLLGTTALVGEKEIRDGLGPYVAPATMKRLDQSDIRLSLIRFAESGDRAYRSDTVSHNSPSSRGAEVTVASVLVAAAVDSVNPCAIAVLVVLLAYLTSLRDRKKLLGVGIVYIGTVFVVYLLSGLGFFAVVQTYGIAETVSTFAGLVAVAAGLVQMRDALLNRDGFSLSIPASKKAAIGRYVRRASIPSAVALAALVSVVELPCTGGMYLAVLGLLSSRMTFADGFLYLVLYNCVFVLPLAFILLGVYFGGSPDRVDAWRVEKRRGIRFAIGCVMLGLGGAMLLGLL
ncbi:cytochrome c biogenesis protein CcdA [Methanofollis aquaemaris]|nr:cytochrome c biogenesis protein CcdA [Methanofollis aquaemaris]